MQNSTKWYLNKIHILNVRHREIGSKMIEQAIQENISQNNWYSYTKIKQSRL